MDEDQLDLFLTGASARDPSPHPREAEPEELQARRRAQQLPVDQRALNVIGLAQARAALEAGRTARIKVERSCRDCGSDIADVTPNRQHYSAWCADCQTFSHHVSRTYLGLARRPVSDSRRNIPAGRRARILARDNGRCVLCGRSAAEGVQLTVGHLVSVKDGERLNADEGLIWDDLNLAAMCDTCQLGLRDVSVGPVVYLALICLRAKRARSDGNWPATIDENPPPDNETQPGVQ